MKSRRGLLRELVLWLGAVLGGLSLLVTVAMWLTETRPVVVRSDSMAPAFTAGDLVMTRMTPAEAVSVGDVVSVIDEAGVRVAHRVEEITGTGAERTMRLRGDANHVADPQDYVMDEVERVELVVPSGGHVVSGLESTEGRVLAGLLVVACWAAVLRPTRRSPSRGRHTALPAVVLCAGAALPFVATADRAWAVFGDEGAVQTGSQAAHRVVPQAQPTCANVGGIAGLLGSARTQWTHVDARYSYQWQARRVSDGAVLASGVVAPTGAAGTTVTLDISTSLLNLGLGGVDVDVVVTARLRTSSAWLAGTSTTTRVHTVALLVGLSVRCGSVP